MRVNVSRLVESYSIFLKRAGDKTGLEIAINSRICDLIVFPFRLKYLEKSQNCDLFFLCTFEIKRLPVSNLLLL